MNERVGEGFDVTHGRGSSFRKELLDGGVCSDYSSIEVFASNRINRWTVVNEKNPQHIRVFISTNIESMKIQSCVSVDARKILGSDPLDSGC